MNKLFILSGASGAGKSTLLDRLVESGYCNAITKFSDRKRFNTIDDVYTVTNINDPKLECDLLYSMYGNNYGFSSKSIAQKLKYGNQILITNSEMVIKKLKSIFPNKVVVIYIVSDINKHLLRQIYIRRNGCQLKQSDKDKINTELRRASNILSNGSNEKFVEHIEKINNIIDNAVLEDEGFKLRLESIKHQEELYLGTSIQFDYVVLNLYSNNTSTVHATKSAFDQLKKIIVKESEKEIL